MKMFFEIKVLVSVLLLTSTLIQSIFYNQFSKQSLKLNFVLIVSEAVFAKIGNYSEYLKYGLNSPECGFRNIANTFTITRSDKCFNKTVGNITWNDQENAFPEWMPNTRIAFGRDTEIGEAPWVVSIKIILKGKDPAVITGHCSGVLITLDWVLTSGNCFK